jgi:DNA-binding XRE family transcriptional regulator
VHGTLLLAVSLEPREIGQRIRLARERKGWTQLAFALEADVSPSTVQRWEGGKLSPRFWASNRSGSLRITPLATRAMVASVVWRSRSPASSMRSKRHNFAAARYVRCETV